MGLTGPGDVLAPLADAGWIWDVYPRRSDLPMVAQGHSSLEARARTCVEAALNGEETAGWGVVIGPGGQTDVCRRNGSGGFTWRPLFAELAGSAPALDDEQTA